MRKRQGDLYFNPFDIYRWAADAYPFLTLVRTFRDPQGWHVGIFDLVWDGVSYQVAQKDKARLYDYNLTNYLPWDSKFDNEAYKRRCYMSGLACDLIRRLPGRDSLLDMAENLILSTELYHYLLKAKPTYLGQGSSSSKHDVRLNGNQIKVECRVRNISETFSLAMVRKSIAKRLEPQQVQLKLLA